MKASVKVSPSIIIEVEGAKQKDLFKNISSAQEVFGEKFCGLCGSDDIFLAWRQAAKVTGRKSETFDFPEMKCRKCFAKLAFGTINDDSGTLFPQRKLSKEGQPLTKEQRDNGEGEYGEHNGWFKFKGQKQE